MLLLVVLAVIGGIAVVATGRGGGLAPADGERSPRGALPPGDVGRDEVDALRFTLAVRGYRMDEVDAVLERLLGEVERRDARIAELEDDVAGGAGGAGGAGSPSGAVSDDPSVTGA